MRCIHQWLTRDERVGLPSGGYYIVTHLTCIHCKERRHMTFMNSHTFPPKLAPVTKSAATRCSHHDPLAKPRVTETKSQPPL